MAVKFEKITLWTALDTYGGNDRGLSARDCIIPEVEGCTILDSSAEDYKLVKVEAAKNINTTALYIVDEDRKEVIEQPFDFHRMSIDVHNEDGYTNLLVHGVSIYFTKEEAEAAKAEEEVTG